MNNNKLLLRTGVIGTLIAVLCCFTPLLVILFGAVGLSALTGYLDFVLIPALLFFIALTGYALYRKRNVEQSGITSGNTEDSQ